MNTQIKNAFKKFTYARILSITGENKVVFDAYRKGKLDHQIRTAGNITFPSKIIFEKRVGKKLKSYKPRGLNYGI